MSLQSRLEALVAAIGADVKSLTNHPSVIANRQALGQEVFPKELISNDTVAALSGTIPLNYFTAYKSETITHIRTYSGNTAAALATICKVGLYLVNADETLTRVAISASDTSLWSTTFGEWSVPLLAPYDVVKGTRYAAAQLIVTAGTLPTWPSRNVAAAAGNIKPRVYGQRGSQTDLPASITVAQINNGTGNRYMQILPSAS